MRFAEDAYMFAHGLLHSAAYELQLPSERERLHGLAVYAMERVLGPKADGFARDLALHTRIASKLRGQRERFLSKERRYLRKWAERAWGQLDTAASLDAWMRLCGIERPASKHYFHALAERK